MFYVDIEDKKPRTRSSDDADVAVRPSSPPFADDLLGGGGVPETVLGAGMLTRLLTPRAAAGTASPDFKTMDRQDWPASGCVVESALERARRTSLLILMLEEVLLITLVMVLMVRSTRMSVAPSQRDAELVADRAGTVVLRIVPSRVLDLGWDAIGWGDGQGWDGRLGAGALVPQPPGSAVDGSSEQTWRAAATHVVAATGGMRSKDRPLAQEWASGSTRPWYESVAQAATSALH